MTTEALESAAEAVSTEDAPVDTTTNEPDDVVEAQPEGPSLEALRERAEKLERKHRKEAADRRKAEAAAADYRAKLDAIEEAKLRESGELSELLKRREATVAELNAKVQEYETKAHKQAVRARRDDAIEWIAKKAGLPMESKRLVRGLWRELAEEHPQLQEPQADLIEEDKLRIFELMRSAAPSLFEKPKPPVDRTVPVPGSSPSLFEGLGTQGASQKDAEYWKQQGAAYGSKTAHRHGRR